MVLIPTFIYMNDKRVRFEDEPAANLPPQQKPQRTLEQRVSTCLQPQWCEVRRDIKGRKIIVAHKAPCYGNGPTAEGGGKGGTEDVKKGANGNGGGKKAEKKEEGKAADDKKDGENKDGGGGGDEKKSDEMSAEDDEKLKALKLAEPGRPWKDIAEDMGKPMHILKHRWREIDPAKAGGDGEKKGGGAEKGGEKKNGDGGDKKAGDKADAAEDKKKDEEPKKLTKKERKALAKEEAKKPTEEAKPAAEKPTSDNKPPSKPASKAGSKAGSKASGGSGYRKLEEDETFSFGELQLLYELITKYKMDRWSFIASRFYDKTGKRVHPEEVKEKFAALDL